jgi:DNA-binding transcriptional regulator LsrR (DeoR family)
MRLFGSVAAMLVLGHLRGKIGVAWGRAVAAVVDGLACAFPEPPFEKGRLSVFPVCGEPLYVATHLHAFSSSVLAARLGDTLLGDATDVPSLTGVGAYLPSTLRRGAAQGTREYLATVPGYRTIVGRGDGLLAQADTLLTGIGILSANDDGYQHGVFLGERLVSEGITAAELDRLVFGDIAGVLIARPGLSKAEQDTVARLNRGWTGLTVQDIKACVTRARQRGHGGVIVVCQDGQKHEFVHELVRRGLVNHLVVNRGAAKRLLATTVDAGAMDAGGMQSAADGSF